MASATALATRISYTGAEKAAIVLLSLGAEASADLMKKFSEEEVAAVGAAMARFGVVSPKDVEGVLEEFHVALETRDVDVNGGLEQVRTLLTNAFGREYATRLLDRVEKSLERDV